ncbi:MAG: DNA polymerase IV [Acidobacteria bacterium]|nr:DNA polymerase IV [Acidobacteriota bacterium]MBI3282267.1 DNA polymerase IV [Acidobacteriota bacterium]
MKTYFHVDMDAFFVSVEEIFDPSLKGKPVVVGGGPDQRGVVSAASYAARKFGVHSAMPLRTAYQHCPHAIFLEGHPHRYREYSEKVFRALNRFSPQVEMASIDEAYLDLTGTERLHGRPLKAAHELHEAIRRDTALNCSIGIATSRMLAKVASDQAKPNGILWILPGQEAAFLAPLDVRKLPGVGKVTERRLAEYGIRKVGDVARLEPAFLERHLGEWGAALAGKAQGLDAGGWFEGEVGAREDPKSISHEHTFAEDTTDAELLESTLAKLSQMVSRRLREHELHARTVQLKLRYSDFSTITRALTLERTTQLDIDLIEHSRLLFRRNWTGEAVRLLGVQASSLDRDEGQLDLFEGERTRRWRKALGAVDQLRDKFGESVVSVASGLKGVYEEKTHENPAGLPGRRRRKE